MTVSTPRWAWAAFSPSRAVAAPSAKPAAFHTGDSAVGLTLPDASGRSNASRWAVLVRHLVELASDALAAGLAAEDRKLPAIDGDSAVFAGVVDAKDFWRR
jgi:hypothetical protein